jgi:phenylalanine-4-hydroxylase
MQMAIIYHSVPLAVILNPKYRDFMYRFGKNTKHIIDCHEANEEVIARFKSQ